MPQHEQNNKIRQEAVTNPTCESLKYSRNIVLVGVAGVGKTTLGREAAALLGMKFIDGDLAFEAAEGLEINDLMAKYGKEYDQRLLDFSLATVDSMTNTIFANSAGGTDKRRFWEGVRKSAISIHLRGKPMEIYRRVPIFVHGEALKDEQKEDEWRIRDFLSYHRWRVRHCGKADHTLRIVGNRQKDSDKLCCLIKRIMGQKSAIDEERLE